jgi:hypothetical protein
MFKTIPTTCPSAADVGPAEDKGAEIYGILSPRGGDMSSSIFALPLVLSTSEGKAIAMVVAPVLQIMSELRELCANLGFPVDHMKVDSPANLCVILDSPMSGDQLEMNSPERLDVALAAIPPMPAHNPNALFAKELCNLLNKVEVACPRCKRAIAYLLTGTKIKGKRKKVGDCPRSGVRKEKSLRCKHKKSAAICKVSTAA